MPTLHPCFDLHTTSSACQLPGLWFLSDWKLVLTTQKNNENQVSEVRCAHRYGIEDVEKAIHDHHLRDPGNNISMGQGRGLGQEEELEKKSLNVMLIQFLVFSNRQSNTDLAVSIYCSPNSTTDIFLQKFWLNKDTTSPAHCCQDVLMF